MVPFIRSILWYLWKTCYINVLRAYMCWELNFLWYEKLMVLSISPVLWYLWKIMCQEAQIFRRWFGSHWMCSSRDPRKVIVMHARIFEGAWMWIALKFLNSGYDMNVNLLWHEGLVALSISSVLRYLSKIMWPWALIFEGVGLALAEEFLRNGDNVVICSRSGMYSAFFASLTILCILWHSLHSLHTVHTVHSVHSLHYFAFLCFLCILWLVLPPHSLDFDSLPCTECIFVCFYFLQRRGFKM